MYISVSFFIECTLEVEANIKTDWRRFYILFLFNKFDKKLCQKVFFPDLILYQKVGLDNEFDILL